MAMLIIFGSPDGAGRFDNMEKGARVETRAADQKAVNIVLFHEFGGVFRLHTAAVKDAEVGSLGPEQVGEDGADFVMDLVGLFRGGHPAGANGPDGLVGDDQLGYRDWVSTTAMVSLASRWARVSPTQTMGRR